MRITSLIDLHNGVIDKTIRDTTLNNVIIDANTIIDSANIIIDSAHNISIIAKDIVYNISASVLHNIESFYAIHDTIAGGNNHMYQKAMDILKNYKYHNGNDVVTVNHSLDIISTAGEVISKADKMITKASNDISLANEAHKKFQAESFSG